MSTRFNPGRGGHAPTDLRDAFEAAVEEFSHTGRAATLLDLCGQRWNCFDINAKSSAGRDPGSDREQRLHLRAGWPLRAALKALGCPAPPRDRQPRFSRV
jgi:hypothetical protein